MNVLLIDDHQLVAEALEGMLTASDPDMVVTVCNSCEDALALPQIESFELILLDYFLGGDLSGPAALESLKQLAPDSRVVVVSQLEEHAKIRGMIDAGAAGFIPKSRKFDEMKAALNEVTLGKTYLPPDVLDSEVPPETLVSVDPEEEYLAEVRQRVEELTPRQKEVLEQIVACNTNKVIARALSITVHTVKRHVSDVLSALGLKSRTEAVYLVARLKWRYKR